jgi:hypothetical protein
MKRWNSKKGTEVESIFVDAFLEKIIEVCKEYKLSISHEDGQGSFIIELYDKDNIEWLSGASINI